MHKQPLTRLLSLLFFGLLISSQAFAISSFDARYRVTSNQYSLAPSATIEHRLTHNQGELYSRMKASIPFSRWEESAHFELNGQTLTAQKYDKATRVFLKRRSYSLPSDAFEYDLPAFDRQSAIFYMAMKAPTQAPDTTASILQVSARGEADKLIIDFAGITEYQNEKVAEVFFWKEKEPAEYTHAYFSVDQPGLLIFAQVYGSEGEKLLTFQLQDWNEI